MSTITTLLNAVNISTVTIMSVKLNICVLQCG